MNQYTVVTVMLGMNRFHQKDVAHPFDMTALDGYNTIWMPKVTEVEKTNSTLFYEALQAVENSIHGSEAAFKKSSIPPRCKDDFVFIFGRGTIGSSQEERLFEAWRSCMQYYGNDVRHVIQAFLDKMTECLTDGNRLEFRDFGVFEVVERKQKIGRNPKNASVPIVIPARPAVKFTPRSAPKSPKNCWKH